MISLREIKEKGYLPHRTYLKILIVGTFTLIKTLITNMGDLKKLRNIPSANEKYIRPKRRYELPEYKKEMKSLESNDKYLRPTLYCNPRSPRVIALAHELGAFKKSDREFAEAAFDFVKRKMTFEIVPMNEVDETLDRGTGSCFHLISVFIALCRAAGIKARYKMFAMNMIQAYYDILIDVDPLIKKWYNAMGYFLIEGEGEAFIDGKWEVSHVSPTPEQQAASGIPITTFGEDSLGVWFFAIPGTIMISESIPYGIGPAMRVLKKIAPGSMDRVNLSIQKQITIGMKVLIDEGGEKNYDKKVRKKNSPKSPKLDLKEISNIQYNK